MSMRLLSTAVAVLLLPAAAGAINDVNDHPFANAKVGDWVSYTLSTNPGGVKIEGTIKMTVTAQDGKTATLTSVATINGMEAPGQDMKIDLTRPYDPLTMPGQGGVEVKVEKKEEARDKVTVGGKVHDCARIKMRIKAGGQDGGLGYDATLWLSKDVPLGGMLRMDMKSDLFDLTLEFKESGREKK